MNENHSALCSSPEWAEFLTAEVLTPLTERLDLGNELLELGPGYGAATRWLRHRVNRLVALELDATMARRLADEFSTTNVTVQIGDCTCAPFADASFDSVATFTMLHHLPTAALQYTALAEAFRLLPPEASSWDRTVSRALSCTTFTTETPTTRSIPRGCSCFCKRSDTRDSA